MKILTVVLLPVLVNPSSSTAINMCSTIPAINICALSPVNPGISAAFITPPGNLRLYVPIASLSYLVKEVAFSWCIALPQDRLCSPDEAFLLLIRIIDTRYLTSSGGPRLLRARSALSLVLRIIGLVVAARARGLTPALRIGHIAVSQSEVRLSHSQRAGLEFSGGDRNAKSGSFKSMCETGHSLYLPASSEIPGRLLGIVLRYWEDEETFRRSWSVYPAEDYPYRRGSFITKGDELAT
ncbi:hypothetical protein An18g01870 [Aspergillus niger]|uniref:Uncharacterized protein n=2 Tax=Aspergillus niger TaxID=5061 RepID=A2RA44_ASPNC|nr:hypothetical protein An18g01870 [Aspergillus niger]CAK47259.1 hypothetical protein An18g01870 [Aspergillus niger]